MEAGFDRQPLVLCSVLWWAGAGNSSGNTGADLSCAPGLTSNHLRFGRGQGFDPLEVDFAGDDGIPEKSMEELAGASAARADWLRAFPG